MTKSTVASWDTTASLNTDIGGINIDEGCPAPNLNNAVREIMAQVKTLNPVGAGAVQTLTAAQQTQARANISAFVAYPGVIIDFAGSTAPNGFLFCYGQAISRTTYAALFTEIGTTFGVGDGTTTFNVPDARGRVAAGKDNMGGTSANRLTNLTGGLDGDVLGATGGAEAHTLLPNQIPAHQHNIPQLSASTGTGTATIRTGDLTGAGSVIATDANTGGGDYHNNTQPTIIFNKIIYTGVFV